MNEEEKRAIREQLESIRARYAPSPLEPDEFSTADYAEFAGLVYNTADGHLRREVKAKRLAVRKARDPKTGRICNAYRKQDNIPPAA